ESEWDDLLTRAAGRRVLDGSDLLRCRSWAALSAVAGASDPMLAADLDAAIAAGPTTAALHNVAGIAAGIDGRGVQAAGRHFRAALDADPRHPVAALNLVESLVEMGQRDL